MNILAESKMDDKEVLKAAKSLAKNGKDEKTKSFGQGLVDYYKENNSFTPNQVSGLQNIMKNASFQMAKEDTDVSTADFINHVENEDFVEAKDAFDALIHQKAYEHIRSAEAEIAAKMFESTSREKRDFKRREMEVELGDESANNVSITIDGKLWKVIPGESENPTRALARADKMANTIKRNAAAKGRKVPKVDVRVTGLKPTETSGSSRSARLWR